MQQPSIVASAERKKSGTIKILCLSDVIDTVVYSTQIKQRFADIDLIISAGDLPMPYLGFITSSLNRPLLFVFGNHNLRRYDQFNRKHTPFPLPPTTISIVETKDEEKHIPRTFGTTYLRGKIKRVAGLLVGGIGGSRNYNNGPNQYSELQMWYRIIKMIPRMLWNKIVHGRYIDILVTHAAPEGINDLDDPCHRGFRCFLYFMRLFRPRYLLHGHIHLYDANSPRAANYMDTQIINVYSHYVLQFGLPSSIRKATTPRQRIHHE